MKIKYLDERFNSVGQRKLHFEKHVKDKQTEVYDPELRRKVLTFTFDEFPDEYSYEKAAERLANTPATKIINPRDIKYGKYKFNQNEKCYVFTGRSVIPENADKDDEKYEQHQGTRFRKYKPSTWEFTSYTIENGEYINMTYFKIKPSDFDKMVKSKDNGVFAETQKHSDTIK